IGRGGRAPARALARVHPDRPRRRHRARRLPLVPTSYQRAAPQAPLGGMMLYRLFAALTALLLTALLPSLAVAQELPGAADVALVQDIAKLIRWTGVLSSLFVVLAAAIALRFVRNFVERLSHQFTTR